MMKRQNHRCREFQVLAAVVGRQVEQRSRDFACLRACEGQHGGYGESLGIDAQSASCAIPASSTGRFRCSSSSGLRFT